MSAPFDQQNVPHLRGGELVKTVNLSEDGRLHFYLPLRTFGFKTHFGRAAKKHVARLTTVFIEPHTRTVAVVYQTSLAVSPLDVDFLDSTTIEEIDAAP